VLVPSSGTGTSSSTSASTPVRFKSSCDRARLQIMLGQQHLIEMPHSVMSCLVLTLANT
jgi:hypothetical protein